MCGGTSSWRSGESSKEVQRYIPEPLHICVCLSVFVVEVLNVFQHDSRSNKILQLISFKHVWRRLCLGRRSGSLHQQAAWLITGRCSRSMFSRWFLHRFLHMASIIAAGQQVQMLLLVPVLFWIQIPLGQGSRYLTGLDQFSFASEADY